jgi:hypothetical protein
MKLNQENWGFAARTGEKPWKYYGDSDNRMHWVFPCQAQGLDWQICVMRSSQLNTVDQGKPIDKHPISAFCEACSSMFNHICHEFAQVQALVSFSWEGKRILAGLVENDGLYSLWWSWWA